MKKRVVVAMSGGVDSSLAAFLLKERGYEVIGATMCIGIADKTHKGPARCCGIADIEDARRVAIQLEIPFYVFHVRDEFEREVIQYFCEEYAKGRTPNPCILCNERIKFGSFVRKAMELKADYVSTGHYAKSELDEGTKRYLLKKGVDRRKDQSYVLFSLRQDQLRYILFPLGGYRKEEVRERAFQVGLRVHDKPESQEICFVQDASYQTFLSERLEKPIQPGPIIDRKGSILGRHRGIPFYTIGQRRGLGLAKGKPLYVVGIDLEKNAVIVGEEKEVYADTFTVDSVNWIVPPPHLRDCVGMSLRGSETTGAISPSIEKTEIAALPSVARNDETGLRHSLLRGEGGGALTAQVKIRYNHPGAEALLFLKGGDEIEVKFKTPQKAITPGQAAVFYDGDTVLGGGWIKEVIQLSMTKSS